MTSVSEASHSSGCNVPNRSARSRTCCFDSSAVRYSARRPPSATPRTIWRSKVDLPMPGSPCTSVTDPGTSPPPSTRSTSGMPVGAATHSAKSIWSIGNAISVGVVARPALAPLSAGTTTSSSRVLHAPHAGQRPAHLASSWPQSRQRKRVRVRDIVRSHYAGGRTASGEPRSARTFGALFNRCRRRQIVQPLSTARRMGRRRRTALIPITTTSTKAAPAAT